MGLSGNGIEKELFNKEEILLISDTAQNYWNYKNNNEHRFNEATTTNGTLVCKRKISYIKDFDISKEKLCSHPQ